MVAKKPRIVIIGAGMAGLTAASKLHTCRSPAAAEATAPFEVVVVEGGTRVGGRINTSEFGGDRIEMGATWIHGIGGSPVHEIATQIHALSSDQPWECMDGSSEDPTRFSTVAEGGFELDRSSLVEPVSTLFKSLMDYPQKKPAVDDNNDFHNIAQKSFKSLSSSSSNGGLSVGSFLRKGLDLYWASKEKEQEEVFGYGNWKKKSLEEGVFQVYENTQRTYTSAGDLSTLDYVAESEYRMCSGEEITIAKGYMSIIQYLASALPPGVIQLGKRVKHIEWQIQMVDMENGYGSNEVANYNRPVKIHFCDGSTMVADHVIVTVSLGVLKAGVVEEDGSSALFSPPLPSFKTEAIRRLGFGVVNKLFVQLNSNNNFPFLQMVFRKADSELSGEEVPWWMRKTASMFPIYENSNVLLSWFAGKEALELEQLSDEEIKSGVSATISSFLSKPKPKPEPEPEPEEKLKLCNGNGSYEEEMAKCKVKVKRVLKSQWGNDPLFLGSYSYVAVGSSGDDLDRMAEPLPRIGSHESANSTPPPLQLLFAGEATHRTHYSTTHGAYFSGLREANRLLQHYHCLGV